MTTHRPQCCIGQLGNRSRKVIHRIECSSWLTDVIVHCGIDAYLNVVLSDCVLPAQINNLSLHVNDVDLIGAWVKVLETRTNCLGIFAEPFVQAYDEILTYRRSSAQSAGRGKQRSSSTRCMYGSTQSILRAYTGRTGRHHQVPYSAPGFQASAASDTCW